MTGGMAGGTTPLHQHHPLPGNTGEPMYPRPPAFPCPLPVRPAFPCPFPWSPSCSPLFPCAHFACSYRLLLAPHPCPAPRCLPVHFAGSHSLALPPAGRGAPPLLRCSVLPALPLYAARHWVVRCAPLPTPPVNPGAPTFPPLSCSQWMVSCPGSGGWWQRRWCSMCASASYRAACWRRASLCSSARTAALTCEGDPGGGYLNERWGCSQCRTCPPPFPPSSSWCPVPCLASDAPASPFHPLPVRACSPVRTPLSSLSAPPASARPRLLLPFSFLRTSGRMDFMAAADTLGAAGCPQPRFTAILLPSSPSSSKTTRMSSPTNPSSLSLSVRLNGSAYRLATACSPRPSPCPSAPAATTPVLPPLASAYPPLSSPSPVPAVASSFLFCSSVRRPSCWTVSGLSWDEGEDTSADAAEDVGKGDARLGGPAFGPR